MLFYIIQMLYLLFHENQILTFERIQFKLEWYTMAREYQADSSATCILFFMLLSYFKLKEEEV